MLSDKNDKTFKTIGNKILSKYILLFTFIFLSGLFICFNTNIKLHICGMILLCAGAIVTSNFDLMHPYCWFSIVFTLYSISYPIAYLGGIYGWKYGYSSELMLLQWVALVVFLLFVSPKKTYKLTNNKITRKNNIFNKILYTILSVYVYIAIISIVRSGFATKGEIYTMGGLFYAAAFRAALMLTIVFMYILIQKLVYKGKFDIRLIIFTGIPLCLLTLFSGERDIAFRYIVVTLFIAYYFKYIRNIHIILLSPLCIVLLVFSAKYKYYFISGTLGTGDITINNIFYHFLTSEFTSASRNLQILINHKTVTNGIFKGYTFINDFLRAIFIDTGFGCVDWFKNTFFENSPTGPGFTLVGEGYINGGYLGIVFLFIIIALLISYLYKKSSKNIYWLTIYVYTIPLYMYAIRADLSNIISPFIKHLLISMGIIYILQWSSKHIKNNIHKQQEITVMSTHNKSVTDLTE